MASKKHRVLIIASMIVMVVYFMWRTFYTLPSGWSLILGLMLLFVEGISIFQAFFFHLIIANPTKRTPAPLPDKPFTVDITIATYNEPVAIVRKTVLACLNLDYPQEYVKIWVCDDGRREEIRRMTEELGVMYLTRPTGEHAKAGNLNNALRYLSGDLMLTLDADMMPLPQFLKRTVGFFAENEKLAFVQTPQVFYNEDIFQYNYYQGRSIPNEQDMFMRLIQSGRDRYNATIFVGSNAVFRRSALLDVGGFVTGTVTEDLATGMIIQAKGFDTYALNEVLAVGLSSESISDQIKQRSRWARGTIQTMRKFNPLTIRGLTFMQRMLYFSNLLYWYFGFTRMVFVLAPICFFLFGTTSVETNLWQLMAFWLPYFLLSMTMLPLVTGKKIHVMWNAIYENAMAPTIFLASMVETFSKKEIPFQVTPKGVIQNKTTINYSFILPHFVLLVVSVILLALNIHRVADPDPIEQQRVIVNAFWVSYNIVVLLLTILLGFERPRMRSIERFNQEFRIGLAFEDAQGVRHEHSLSTLDISDQGVRILLPEMIELPQRVELELYGDAETIRVQGEKVFYDKYQDKFQASFKIDFPSIAEERLWLRTVYGSVDRLATGTFQAPAYRSFLQYITKFQFKYRAMNRRHPRINTNLKGWLDSRDYIKTTVRIVDISISGALLEADCNTNVRNGEPVTLSFPGIDFEFSGKLTRIGPKGKKTKKFGMIFDEEISLSAVRLIQSLSEFEGQASVVEPGRSDMKTTSIN